MRLNDIELTIFVKNRPITEYPLLEQMFVEGRAGSEYEIEVRNHTLQRIEAVISVDGLSVLDGKPAGAASRGYLVGACNTLRIPGWTLNTQSVAKFTFAGKQASYVGQMTGDTRNTGVIGLMAYREKINYHLQSILCSAGSSYPYSTPMYNSQRGTEISNQREKLSRGIAPQSQQSSSLGIAPSYNAASNASSSECKTSGGVIHDGMITTNYVEQSLGTAFGGAQSFATTTVRFERDGVICTMVMGYDEKRGLKARGIRFERRRKSAAMPQAFPGIGCSPPPGWQG